MVGAMNTIVIAGDQWLKVLHASGRGANRKVDALLAHPIAGMSEEEVHAWLKQAWTERGLEPGEVLLANPSHLTTVRLFALPSTDPNEIRDIVELQAEKHTPYAKEEILTDFLVVESDRSGYSRVLVVISHQDVVHRGLRLVEAMGWPLHRVGFELEGLIHWFRAGQPVDSDTLVVDIDSETSTLLILQGGRPCYYRSLGIGSKQLAEDPTGGPARMLTEVQRSLETFEQEGQNIKAARVVLTGQAGRFPDLGASLQQALSLPSAVVPSTEKSSLAERALKDAEQAQQVSLASLLGLAMGPGEVDLTPKTIKLHRTFEVRSRALVRVGCQLIGVLLLLSMLAVGKSYKAERYHAWLRTQYEEVGREAGSISEFVDQMKVVEAWLEGGGELLESVVELYRYTPESMRWSALAYTRGEQVSLRGTAPEIPQVFDMVAQLQRSPVFSSAEARRTTKKKVGEEDVTEFEIVCGLGAAAETEPEQEAP
ncbi:MAG: pilus assembly protein PilM [Candidatus Omnitrophica bacterium]|nr:pilus assembly protein PilM [Candidatus Omnitrophota bacterium]